MTKNKYKFEQIAFNITEKGFPKPEDKENYIGLEHLDSGKLNVTRWGSEVELIGQKLVMHKGDVLFGRRNTYLRRVAIAPHDGFFSAHGMIWKPNEEVVDKDFFPYFIQSDYFMNEAIRISVGSLSPTVNWKDLKELSFSLPSLDRQKELAILMSSLNRTKEAYTELLNRTDDIIKARFVEMFGDPNNNEKYEKFEEAFTIRDDLRKPLSDLVRSNMRENAQYPYYGANGQVDLINDYITDYGKAICLAEDCGAYGPDEESSYIIDGKCWVNNHAHVLLPKENCNIYYLNKYLHMLDISKRINGSTRQKLTQGAMKELPVIIPSKEKQDEFGIFVEQIDKSKFAIQNSLDSVEKLMKSLINKEFND